VSETSVGVSFIPYSCMHGAIDASEVIAVIYAEWTASLTRD